MGNYLTNPVERFRSYVREDRETGCWLWTGYVKPNGYATFWPGGPRGSTSKVYAHRWAYEHFVGPIPEGLTIDHLCKTPTCMNPAHMEPVTMEENIRRAAHKNAGKTHCKRGHEFTPENTYVRPDGGGRSCWECVRTASRIRKARQRKARGAKPARKLTADKVHAIRNAYATGGVTLEDLSAEYSVSIGTISRAINRQSWKHVA